MNCSTSPSPKNRWQEICRKSFFLLMPPPIYSKPKIFMTEIGTLKDYRKVYHSPTFNFLFLSLPPSPLMIVNATVACTMYSDRTARFPWKVEKDFFILSNIVFPICLSRREIGSIVNWALMQDILFKSKSQRFECVFSACDVMRVLISRLNQHFHNRKQHLKEGKVIYNSWRNKRESF